MSRKNLFRLEVIIVLILSLVGCRVVSDDEGHLQQLADSVTIYRDAYGVPHVHGATDAAAAFGFAYAQAEDNFWQIEDNFIRAIGRSAEVYGRDALLDDWINRGLETTRLSIEEYEKSSPEVRALLDGYAEGLNFYVAHNPEVEPRLLDRFEPWHVLAFIRYLYYQRGFLFGTRIPRDAFMEQFTISTGTSLEETAALALPATERGSNSWAVTPKKSASGNAMLLINPHLPFFGPSQVYEGHVMSDEGWNFSGYTRFGFPQPYVGFNEHLGWASTDNAADLQDVYMETFDDPDDPLAYRYGDEHRKAEEWTETIRIKTETGVEEQSATFRKTHHGPILAVRDDRPLAVRMAKFEEPGWLAQWYGMSRATTLEEFKAAVSPLDMLFGNYLYADEAGNIYYVYNAAVPRRDPQFDWTAPVDGSDPQTEWQGYHSMEEIPQLLNPESGFLQNCNGTPFLSTSSGNPDPKDFPSYMVREGDNPRHREARRILSARDTFTSEQWAADAYSTHALQAEDDIPQIVDAWEELKKEDPTRAEKLREAVALLGDWDRVSTVESEAMSLYVFWGEDNRRLRREDNTAEKRVIRALEAAMARIEKDWGTWRVAWSEINRLQRRHSSGDEAFRDDAPSIPLAGVPGWAGAMFTFYARPVEGQKRRYGTAGNTYVAVVEFGEKVTAKTLHTFGASADPASPHFFDRAPLYAQGAFTPAWLPLAEVKENAVRSYQPGSH
jgi:penicillin amidase